jgi:hypothetical protein
LRRSPIYGVWVIKKLYYGLKVWKLILMDHDNSPLVNVHHSIIETVLLKDLELLQLGENRLPQTSVAGRFCQPKTMARRINKDSAVRMVGNSVSIARILFPEYKRSASLSITVFQVVSVNFIPTPFARLSGATFGGPCMLIKLGIPANNGLQIVAELDPLGFGTKIQKTLIVSRKCIKLSTSICQVNSIKRDGILRLDNENSLAIAVKVKATWSYT